MFYRQQYHVLALAGLIMMLFGASWIPGMLTGEFWGVTTTTWLITTVTVVILHQVYLWFCWRSELQYQLLTDFLGTNAFPIYGSIAFSFLIVRPSMVLITAISNQQSIPLSAWFRWIVSALFTFLFAWTLYSLFKHFSLTRVLGADHFYRELRNNGLVERGLFRYLPHPMYSIGMLGMWIPGLIFESQAALVLALFQHLYIWVHHYTLEQPDMDQIYNEETVT
jgi:protein-S-isoprenylcysteine O-methyltransferase Ste14